MTTPSATSEPPNRAGRRKALTRARLLDAARELFAQQGVEATRIGEITEAADVGAGSFYNHFADKDAIVEAVLRDLAASQGDRVEAVTRDLDDPAAVIAYAHHHFLALARTDPTFAHLLVRLDLSHHVLRDALGPHARRDVRAGMASGRFAVADADVAVYATGGALLGVMRAVLDGALGPDADVQHVEGVLRSLGVGGDEAAALARRSRHR